jgi:hypothetical protein
MVDISPLLCVTAEIAPFLYIEPLKRSTVHYIHAAKQWTCGLLNLRRTMEGPRVRLKWINSSSHMAPTAVPLETTRIWITRFPQYPIPDPF